MSVSRIKSATKRLIRDAKARRRNIRKSDRQFEAARIRAVKLVLG